MPRLKRTAQRPVDLMPFFTESVDHVCIFSPEGYFVHINPTFAKALGYTPQELKSRPVYDFVHPDDRAGSVQVVSDRLQGKPVPAGFVNRYVCKDGSLRYFSWSGVLIDGLFYSVARDITQEKEVAEQLRTTEAELEEARVAAVEAARLSSLGEMAAAIGHEIYNPLTIIQGFADRLNHLIRQKDYDREEVLAYVAKVGRATDRIVRIIHSLKALTVPPSREEFQARSVANILDDVLDLCRDRFRNEGIDLELPPSLNKVIVECLPVELAHVFLNLLNNSFTAVHKLNERWVRIEARKTGKFVEILITDSGGGIPEAIRSRIGEPFFSTKRPGHGTGLGLSISKKIAEKHGGSLALNPRAKNTQFVLRLPARARASL
jgi:PAS domain S-box-containing protein